MSVTIPSRLADVMLEQRSVREECLEAARAGDWQRHLVLCIKEEALAQERLALSPAETR